MSNHTRYTADLEELGVQFRAWRQKYPDKYFPRTLWQKAVELTKYVSVLLVAQHIGFSNRYLRKKIASYTARSGRRVANTVGTAEPQFIELKVEPVEVVRSTPMQVRAQFEHPNGRRVELSFSGRVGDISPLLLDFLGGKPCCR